MSQSLTRETVVMAISKVQVAYDCSNLDAITRMQEAAAKAGDEASLEVLCEVKSQLIALLPGMRPEVTVTPIANTDGDLTHCQVAIGVMVFDAPFTESSSKLEERGEDVCGIRLNVAEVMTVTNASRQQMEREASRLCDALKAMTAGTVATLEGNLYFWLDADQGLTWDQWLTIGGADRPTPHDIAGIGEIDTEELWEVAESIRKWLREPVTVQADLGWLLSQ